jgi:Na+-transporting NADH:ubiquinone oxidoreductase subunit A
MENFKKLKIKKGLNIPLKGTPEQKVANEIITEKVALNGLDYPGLRPKILIKIGDIVKKGDLLFLDKKRERVKFTAPAAGEIVEINRGERRVLESVVIKISDEEEHMFPEHSKEQIAALDRDRVKEGLLNSGIWTGIRQRPFSYIADPDDVPHSVFITVTDTNPLAPSVAQILSKQEDSFQVGVEILSKLTDGKTYVCLSREAGLWDFSNPDIECVEFRGPHPAGNPGTHIHFLDPVNKNKTVWYTSVQDVIAIGKFFVTGRICNERIVALAGDGVNNPRLIKTIMGADLNCIVKNELTAGEDLRVISGSVLDGRVNAGHNSYLGRYHQQISVIKENAKRQFFGWLYPGFKKYSVKNIFMSKFLYGNNYEFDTLENGGLRNQFPAGDYEKVFPLDILPTFLLRALIMGDIEEAEKLGALELGEEDLALCTFVSASKINYGEILRKNLTNLEKEG